MTTGPRIAPITDEECTDEVRAFFAEIDGPGGRRGLSKLNILRTLAHHPELARRYLNFGLHILRFSSLPPRLRELITMRTACLFRADYEWTKHAQEARRLGISEEEIDATRVGSDAPLWSDLDRSALRAVEQLKQDTDVDDETWKVLAEHLDQQQLLDFLFTVGCYAMLAMVLNGLRVEEE
ncbi:MAG: carboxymuconolactone decarboxylase family protein [Acidimicrobiaceae bacterium]|nr:carboxymuconolactone decarboxylase family protein [Acidimicrobiaceae bacterium]